MLFLSHQLSRASRGNQTQWQQQPSPVCPSWLQGCPKHTVPTAGNRCLCTRCLCTHRAQGAPALLTRAAPELCFNGSSETRPQHSEFMNVTYHSISSAISHSVTMATASLAQFLGLLRSAWYSPWHLCWRPWGNALSVKTPCTYWAKVIPPHMGVHIISSPREGLTPPWLLSVLRFPLSLQANELQSQTWATACVLCNEKCWVLSALAWGPAERARQMWLGEYVKYWPYITGLLWISDPMLLVGSFPYKNFELSLFHV